MSLANIGAAWKQEKNGKRYLSGVLEASKLAEQGINIQSDLRVLIFPNDKKTQEKHPDYRFVLSLPDQPPNVNDQRGQDIGF